MRNVRHSIVALALSALLTLQGFADEPVGEDKTRLWENYAAHSYSNLNTTFNGELTPIFRALGDFGELHQYFDKNRNPEKYEAYSQFLIQVFADAKQGDVGEAMFANVLLELTPPDVLLSMIAPEIGPEGKLSGILDGKHSDVAKRIQRQPQQGNIGSANFIQYVRYLKGGKIRGFTNQVNSEVIVDHMFSADPQNAFVSMLWVDFEFRPYSTTPYGCKREEIPKVQELQMAYADISDYLYRTDYNMPKYPFPIPDGLERKVRSQLNFLIEHERRWVRLYVAYLLKSERMLRWSDILEMVGQDPDPEIQRVLIDINSEHPQYLRKPNKET